VSKGGDRNEYAKRGDRIHELTEWFMFNTTPLDGDKGEVAVAKWMADKTKELLARVEGCATPVSVRDELGGEEITFGTIDCWGYDKHDLPAIIDWKTGYPDDYGPQIKVYALGIMDLLETDEIACIIVYGDHQKIERLRVTRMEAEALVNDTIVRQADPNQPFVKSKYCNRCELFKTCPAWTTIAADAIAMSSDTRLDISEGLEVICKDPDKLGRFLKGWKAISKLIEEHDVHGAAIEFLENGIPVGDYEVRERKGRKEFTRDSVATMLELIRDGDMGIDEAATMFRLDVKEVEKFFKESNKPCPIDTIIKGTYKILVDKTNGK
jgi:hypothetical protein